MAFNSANLTFEEPNGFRIVFADKRIWSYTTTDNLADVKAGDGFGTPYYFADALTAGTIRSGDIIKVEAADGKLVGQLAFGGVGIAVMAEGFPSFSF